MKLALWPRGRNFPADPLNNFSSFLERVFDRPTAEHLPEVFRGGLTPPVNIAENEQALTISLELPGLDEDDIDIQILGNQLVVSAERKFEEEKKDKEYHRVEHQYGSFSRSITLPTGLRTDEVDAVYNKGILTLTLAKVEPTPATKIRVRKEKK